MRGHRFSAAIAPGAFIRRGPLLVLGLLVAAIPAAGDAQESGVIERAATQQAAVQQAAVEVGGGETWVPAVLAHSMTRRCTLPMEGPCIARRVAAPVPLDLELEPAERLLPDPPGGYALRIEAGWERLEMRSVSHPAQDAIRLDLGGEAPVEFALPHRMEAGQRLVACLERGPAEAPLDRACYRFGRVPLDWGEPIGIDVRPTELTPSGNPRIAILLAGEWVEAPVTSSTRTDGELTILGHGLRAPDHPASHLTPLPDGERFRVYVAAGWDHLKLRRGISLETEAGVAGPEHRAFEETISLARDGAHELLIPSEGEPGEGWSLCVTREDSDARSTHCHRLIFAAVEG